MRDGLIVLAGVPDIGIDLGKCFLAILSHKALIGRQRFLGRIILVDEFGCIGLIGLLMNERREGESVLQVWVFGGPSYGKGGHGKGESRQMQTFCYLSRRIQSGSQITDAQSLLFGQIAEGLCIEQSIGGCIHETEQVVVSWYGPAAFTPVCHASEIGTDGEHHRSIGHHRLMEVEGCQRTLSFLGASDHHAVQLQVTHGLCTGSLLQ